MRYKKWLKITLLCLLVILIMVGARMAYGTLREYQRRGNNVTTIITPSISPIVSSTPVVSPSLMPTPNIGLLQKITPSPTANLATAINLDVPFTSQAPHANWDSAHEEACEEASLLMAYWWATKQSGQKESGYANRINPDTAETRLQELIQWQRDTFGYFEDTTAAEVVRMGKEKLGLKNLEIISISDATVIKQELNRGNILIVPAAGQLLGNPNFKQPGPPYHMLVIRGYNDKGFITNDPGTRRGEGYVYSADVLLNALHDWNGTKDNILDGKKVAIIVSRTE